MIKNILSLALITLSISSAFADTKHYSDERPKIGLALAGGGARGGAHIGVLRELERLQVPIDYIAGTSVGSTIGGLYAAGYSLNEIEQIIADIDWDDVLIDSPPRRQQAFVRKREDDNFLLGSRVGFNRWGIQIPAGAIQGQKIDLLLKRLTLPTWRTQHFDHLKIPYRAIAADLVTGESVAQESGSLATAIRASMSIPAVFAPVEHAGRLLGDGGVSNNLPIDVVREMGADIVIAVDIGTPLYAREELTSALAIVNQLTGFLTIRESAKQIAALRKGLDVLMVPQIIDVATEDFNQTLAAVPFGTQIAIESAEELSKYSLNDEDWATYQSAFVDPRGELPVVHFVELENNTRLSDAAIRRYLDIPLNTRLDPAVLERQLAELYGLELFQSATYDVVQRENKSGLRIAVRDRSWGPNYLQFGASYASGGDDSTVFNLGVSYLRTEINRAGGEWRLSGQFGDEPGASWSINQPFKDASPFFVNFRAFIQERVVNRFESGNKIAGLNVLETGGELAIGRHIFNTLELKLGARVNNGVAKVRIGDPTIADVESDVGEWLASIFYDSQNNRYFPTKGGIGRMEFRQSTDTLGGTNQYSQIDMRVTRSFSWGHSTLLAGLDAGITASGDEVISRRFQAGGFSRLSGLKYNEVNGSHYGRLLLGGFQKVGKNAVIPVYAGFTLEYGNVWQSRDDINAENSLFGGSLWLGIDSPIGPLYFARGQSEGGKSANYISLGRGF